jgi:uncharacterized protein (TIGR02598 family)
MNLPAFRGATHAFSLVEIVIVLGVISFALIAVVGLFSFGLQTNRESSDQIQAANLVSLIMSTARAIPTNMPASFALPNLNQGSVTNTVKIGLDGTTTNTAAYNLYYVAGTNAATGANLANVYLLVWWPVAAPMPTNGFDNYYQLSGQVALP